MSNMYKATGLLFMATGVLHTALGILFFHPQLAAIGSAGLVNGIDKRYDRGFAFWFIVAGLLMVALGYLMNWVVRTRSLILPRSFGYALIAICLLGVLVMPVSGFWLILFQGLYIARYATRQERVS